MLINLDNVMQGHNYRAAVKGALECTEEGKKGRKEEEEEQKAQKREEKKAEEVALMCADACSLKQNTLLFWMLFL